MYKSLTKTKKYSELEAHETLERVASANAVLKHYKSSLITVKRHAMVLRFFKSQPCYIVYCGENDLCGVSTQLQSSGLVAHENSTFRNLALAVSGPFMA